MCRGVDVISLEVFRLLLYSPMVYYVIEGCMKADAVRWKGEQTTTLPRPRRPRSAT